MVSNIKRKWDDDIIKVNLCLNPLGYYAGGGRGEMMMLQEWYTKNGIQR